MVWQLKAFLLTSKEPHNGSCTKFKPFAKDKTWYVRQPLIWMHPIYLHEVGWYWCCAEHVWIWYGYVLMCVHVNQCMFMYISMYLLSSSKLREQKRKYTHVYIYSVCRWIIEFKGTTKRLSRDLCTPLNSGGFHWFIPCWVSWCFLKVFAAEWRECDGLTGDAFNHSHLSTSDSTSLTMASVPLQLQWPCTHPKRVSLSAGSQLEHFILLVGWYLAVP